MKTVLVIEDEISILNNICTILQISGYHFIKASNGLQALKILSTQLPHIILCDVMMPEMDGFEVLKNIRKNPITQSIPFCFLTARADIVDIDFGLSIGANAYVTKPFSAKDLLAAVAMLIA
ncbi:MAG: response regulator transcription factor [Chitinophagaceae bacterium]